MNATWGVCTGVSCLQQASVFRQRLHCIHTSIMPELLPRTVAVGRTGVAGGQRHLVLRHRSVRARRHSDITSDIDFIESADACESGSGNDGEPELESKEEKAIMPQILRFLAPVLFIPLIDPLVSVVEAGLIGNFASTTEMAGMAPASLIFLFCVYAFNGLGVQALGDVSRYMSKGKINEASETVSTALVMGATWGLAMAVCLELFGPSILGMLCTCPEVLAHATDFLRIKALALPAFISIFVCNSTHLAQRRQIRALAVQLAGMTSAIALNALFIAKMGLGIRGAAIASVATQYGIVALQLVSLLQIGKSGGVVLDLRRASWSRCVRTVSRLGPLSVMYICKTMAYSVITAAASLTGLLSAAAHQAMWPAFVCCSFLNAPMEPIALAFIPAAKGDKELAKTHGALKTLAIGLGLASACVWLCISLGATQYLTRDPALWGLIRSEAWVGAGILSVTAIDIAAGGVLLAFGSGTAYAVIMATALAATIASTKIAASMGAGLPGVWLSMAVMIGVRVLGTNVAATLLRDPWSLKSFFPGPQKVVSTRLA